MLLSCQNATTLESAHKLLRTVTSNPKLSGRVNTDELLDAVLEDIGFGGLWNAVTFRDTSESFRKRTVLADKLIEVSSSYCFCKRVLTCLAYNRLRVM